MALNLIPLGSTDLESVAYFDAEQILLIVFARRGRAYSYSGVPKAVYNGLIRASSPGTYFRRAILNQFPYQHGVVTPPPKGEHDEVTGDAGDQVGSEVEQLTLEL
jgi:hypothetical protein